MLQGQAVWLFTVAFLRDSLYIQFTIDYMNEESVFGVSKARGAEQRIFPLIQMVAPTIILGDFDVL